MYIYTSLSFNDIWSLPKVLMHALKVEVEVMDTTWKTSGGHQILLTAPLNVKGKTESDLNFKSLKLNQTNPNY